MIKEHSQSFPVNDHYRNGTNINNSMDTEKGKDEQLSNEKAYYDDPMFKQWVNEVIVLFKYLAPKIAELKQSENHLRNV